MATKINFDTAINSSLQVGDTLYYTTSITDNITSTPLIVGVVTKILRSSGDIVVAGNILQPLIAPDTKLYFLFEKDIRANESSLKGYYADVTFANRSTKKAELFAVSSEIALSSK